MGGGKGGQADQSGMYMAMASAQAAEKAYALGEQQLQWTESVYNQQWPTIKAAADAQMALEGQQQKSLEQMQQEAAQQWDTYQKDYLPQEEKLIGQVNDWASLGNQALVRGQAMGTIAEQGQAGMNTAAETLREYGLNPGARKYMSLYTEAQPMLGAAQAAAGTTATQNLKLQQLGLESGVINTGRGMVNQTGALTTAGTQAGAAGANAAQGAGSTLENNLTSGSNANANATQFFNAGSNAMNSYVNAVNGYNDAQAKFAEAGASEMSGFGSAAGGVLGLLTKGLTFSAKGGPIYGYDDGGSVDSRIVSPANSGGGIPPGPSSDLPSHMVPGPPGYAEGEPIPLTRDMYLSDASNASRPPAPPSALAPSGDARNLAKGYRSSQLPPIWTSTNMPPIGSETPVNPHLPVDLRNYMNLGPSTGMAQGGAAYAGGGAGATPAMPSWGGGGGGAGLPTGATPGGTVPVHASPSFGVATDDVPAMLTANEFVIPKDVATWIGHKALAGHIDKARKEQQAFSMRDDIGGEPTQGIPQSPTFVSRPDHAGGARGGWEAALGGGQGAQGGQDWQTALQGFQNNLPQNIQSKIQNWQGGFPTG